MILGRLGRAQESTRVPPQASGGGDACSWTCSLSAHGKKREEQSTRTVPEPEKGKSWTCSLSECSALSPSGACNRAPQVKMAGKTWSGVSFRFTGDDRSGDVLVVYRDYGPVWFVVNFYYVNDLVS